MGYLHINNLYRDQTALMFKRVYALEKIHGTSAHVSFNEGNVGYFAGGESHEKFKSIFDHEKLTAAFVALGHLKVMVHGEAYGGKCQGMSGTYGKNLMFTVFDVMVGDTWLSVPDAHEVANKLGLQFVHYEEVDATVEALDAVRDRPSVQAMRNLGVGDKFSEGVVIRPLREMTLSNGARVIAKHKRPEFSERASKADTVVNPEKALVLADAQAVAEEWVTEMRAIHVTDRLKAALARDLMASDTRAFIDAMTEDVMREGAGEVADTVENKKAIGRQAVKLFQKLR